MNVIKTLLIKYFNYFFLFLFSFLFLSVLFINNSSTFSYKIFPQFISFIMVLGIFFIICFVLFKEKKINTYLKNNYKNILFISMIILMFIQLYIIFSATTTIGWDCGIVVTGATATDLNSSSYYYSYFSTYQNNLFLLFVARILSKIMGGKHLWGILNIVSMICIDISLILTFYIMHKVKNLKTAYISFFLSICTFGLFAWIIVPYSDTLSMPFTIGSYALYLKIKDTNKYDIKDNKNLLKRIIYSIFMALSIFIGYLLKPTVVIVIIGIILCTIIFNIDNIKAKISVKKITYRILPLLIIFITFLGGTKAWNSYIYKQQIIPINKDAAMPMSHFFMLGLNYTEGRYGAWNADDLSVSLSQNTKKEKIEANKKVIKERLKNYGPLGYVNFLLNKARWITSEGNFYWGGEGNFAIFNIDNAPSIVKNIIYTNGKYYSIYQYIIQGIWITLLLLIILSSLNSLINDKQINYYDFSFSIIIFGIILFILLFEGRSRYLILYLPFFTMYASNGLNLLLQSKLMKSK